MKWIYTPKKAIFFILPLDIIIIRYLKKIHSNDSKNSDFESTSESGNNCFFVYLLIVWRLFGPIVNCIRRVILSKTSRFVNSAVRSVYTPSHKTNECTCNIRVTHIDVVVKMSMVIADRPNIELYTNLPWDLKHRLLLIFHTLLLYSTYSTAGTKTSRFHGKNTIMEKYWRKAIQYQRYSRFAELP